MGRVIQVLLPHEYVTVFCGGSSAPGRPVAHWPS